MPRQKDNEVIRLTEKESVIMNLLWREGPLSVRQMLEFYPEPKPHFNTVSTTVRILEDKGYVSHEASGNAFRYFATADMTDYRDKSLSQIVNNYFGNSYKSAVSALVQEEKLSVEELKEIIDMIEKGKED